MKRGIAFSLLLLSALPVRADDAVTAAATSFYTLAASKGFSSVGIPDAAARAKIAPLLSSKLNQELADAAAAEQRFRAKNKQSPPLIEGDIFSSLFEGPTSWKIGACAGNAQAARCAVSMTHQDPGQQAARWIDTVMLVNQNGAWKVDDLSYDANFAFGNTGKLSEMLAMTRTEAP